MKITKYFENKELDKPMKYFITVLLLLTLFIDTEYLYLSFVMSMIIIIIYPCINTLQLYGGKKNE